MIYDFILESYIIKVLRLLKESRVSAKSFLLLINFSSAFFSAISIKNFLTVEYFLSDNKILYVFICFQELRQKQTFENIFRLY